MTTTQKLALTTLVTAAVGTGFFEARRAGQMRASLQEAEGQVQALTEEAAQLRQELDRTANTLKAAQGQLELAQSSAAKLSQEVARLKAQLAANSDANPAATLAGRVALMKSHLEQRPEQRIPELQFAEEKDWLEGAKLVTTESDDDVRKGVSLVRWAGYFNTNETLVAAACEVVDSSAASARAYPQVAGLMRVHSITLWLEGEGYILAMFFGLLVPVFLFRRREGLSVRQRWRHALLINLKGNLLVLGILALAAVFEALEVILQIRT
jgi:hypothetical protein